MSEVKRYRKTAETEAIQWDGDFSGWPDEWRAAVTIDTTGGLIVETNDGPARLHDNDYLARGPEAGEFYPVRKHIWEATYEVAE